ncbi:ABC transporter ATP-binding protein (plasmid) [Bartonella sp. HY329]|uniref:ABC transporter ATP-binding protein n=1 Tax=unclassified Bartonella TaxID=2645622 RepID=UPI0021C934CE|nr:MULTISPECIES: ABC transporter ATP-binding protein [unclassified Bartonella]UXM96656.1 ABC transporter ATP-binding protein [Bartonella sp. HY329]UXN10979.1 ABC transporter ATP-binding protein [Bartonella sp. HY328]
MHNFIDVKNLIVGYNNKIICKDINFQLKQGNVLCILGANGEGKSTLLKTLLGLQKAINGDIFIAGENITMMSLRQRANSLSYVPQHGQSGFSFSVLQMVIMGKAAQLGLFAQPNAKDCEKAHAILHELNIAHLGQKEYANLSGGQKQLVLIARALMQNADIIVLDEPTASLDFYNQFHVIAILAKLKKLGKTIIFTTHHPDQAFEIADEVLMIKDGCMLCHGTTQNVMTEDILTKLYSTSISIFEIEGKKISYIKNIVT